MIDARFPCERNSSKNAPWAQNSLVLLCAMLLALSLPAEAQQAKVPLRGLLVAGSLPAFSIRTEAFRYRLRELERTNRVIK
jgi:hypothetical protein